MTSMGDKRRDPLEAGWRDGSAGVGYVFGAIGRRFWSLVLPPLIATGLALAFVIVVDPAYTASSAMRVEVNESDERRELSEIGTHVELIRSDQNTVDVIVALDLEHVFDSGSGRLRRMILTARRTLGLETRNAQLDEDDRSILIGNVRDGLSVRQIAGTSIIEISYTHASPDLAASIANTYAIAYVDIVSVQASERVQTRAASLQDRADEVQDLISSARAAARKTLRSGDLIVLDANDLQTRVTQLRDRLSLLNDEAAAVDARLHRISEGQDDSLLRTSAVVSVETFADFTRSRERLAQLRERFGTSASAVQQAEAAVETMRRSLELELQRVREDLEVERAVVTAQIDRVEAELGIVLDYSESADWTDLLRAEREAETYEGIRREYLSAIEAQFRAGADIPVALVAEARRPAQPSFPDYKIILIFMVMIGMLVGIGIALAKEWAGGDTVHGTAT